MKTLGIVGGGQLGLMLAEAANTLGMQTIVLDPTPDCPASKAARQVVGDFHDFDTVMAFGKEADVLTFEIESANADALAALSRGGLPVHPTPGTLAFIKDKLLQKNFLYDRNIPVAPFMEIERIEDAIEAGERFGFPYVLKARSGGYDGRGNATITRAEDIASAFEKLAGAKLYAEAFVNFSKELAVVAVRTTEGDIRTYPVVETIHERHICLEVLAPAPVSEDVRKKAETLAHNVLESFEGAGVFAIEMFLRNGEVLVNEIAPRVHNSGHLTIEACETSQFENHVRAVTGMPLGSTALVAPAAVMLNILGERVGPAEPKGIEEAKALGGVSVHIYGKKETKPDRKMGHLTTIANSLPEARAKAEDAWRRVSI